MSVSFENGLYPKLGALTGSRSLPIGVKGFAKLCTSLPTAEPVSNLHSLKVFRYLDPLKDKKTLSPPTATEVLHLMTYGTFNYQRCLSTLPAAEYVVPRQDLAQKAVGELRNARCLLVHSRLGNGKSIFIYVLAQKLSEAGYHCFWCRPNPSVMQREVELLKATKKPAIFFDSYNAAIDLVEHLADLPDDTRFIVAVRTGVQEVRLHEIQSRLPSPIQRVSLNGLGREDIEDFIGLLSRAGILSPGFKEAIESCGDFREIVLRLYDNQEIKDKITEALSPLLDDASFKKVFVTSQLLTFVGQEVDAAFLRSVTGYDAYAEIAKHKEVAGDVFALDDDKIQVRSSMFAEHLIQHHLATSDVIECVYLIVVGAVKRKTERRYQAILSSLMRFSVLDRALSSDPGRLVSLVGLFERLRRDTEVNREPLFWLQYSILMTANDDLPAAEAFIGTAYERAAASPGFQTFQIDTYALRLFLQIERSAESSEKVARFDEIVEKMERVRSMIGHESRRYHAIEVLEEIEPFVIARIAALTRPERNTLVYHLALLVDNMEFLSADERAQSGSDLVRASLLRAKDRILAAA